MKKMNAKQEFMEHIAVFGIPICAKIGIDRYNPKYFILKGGYTEDEYKEFLKSLDFIYDSGYGGQELFGIILFKGSYSDRGEYDGSEWWDNHKKPTVKKVMEFRL